MASVDEIWASMNAETTVHKMPNFEKKAKSSKGKTSVVKTSKPVPEAKEVSVQKEVEAKESKSITYAEIESKINRDVNALADENQATRKTGLMRLHKILFLDYKLSAKDYSEVFHDICRPILKRFADPMRNVLLFSRITTTIPSSLAYDEDLKIFVSDLEAQVDRQDKAHILAGVQSSILLEPSEEIRYLTCDCLYTLLQRIVDLQACPILHPYFEEIILFFHYQLKDPYPEVKFITCQALSLLASIPEFELGMKFYALGLARSLLPVLRHRHIKIRIIALSALQSVILVPNRMKRKASGSEAILDLVGFREENVLPTAAFYQPDVNLNYLAELSQDKHFGVKERLVQFLHSLLTEMEDKYDYQTRLLPYLLDCLTDHDYPRIAAQAYTTLSVCGEQYERDHPEEILEKRQYNVDGNDHLMNLEDTAAAKLPYPFTSRPRIGMRLYVRGNTKRFLFAVVNELTNWMAPARLKSAYLLQMIIVLCEEHLTMEIYSLLPSLLKALKFARDDKDLELFTALQMVCQLLGRYIQPQVYIYYLLPRLRGDSDLVQVGSVDYEQKMITLEMLLAMVEGSKTSVLIAHMEKVMSVVNNPEILAYESAKIQSVVLRFMEVLLTKLTAATAAGFSVAQGKQGAKMIIEAHYLATGRLTSLQSLIRSLFRYLLIQLSYASATPATLTAASSLAVLPAGTSTVQPVAVVAADKNAEVVITVHQVNKLLHLLASMEEQQSANIDRLYQIHTLKLLEEEIAAYEVDATWTKKIPQHQVILRLLEHMNQPQAESKVSVDMIQQVSKLVLDFILAYVGSAAGGGTGTAAAILPAQVEEEFYVAMVEMLLLLMTSLQQHQHESSSILLAFLQQVYAAKIMETMVYAPKWNKTSLLHQKRLEILQLVIPSTSVSGDPGVTIAAAGFLLTPAVLYADHLPRILSTVLPTAFTSSICPELMRLEMITLLDHWLTVIKLRRKTTIFTALDVDKVKPAAVSKNQAKDTSQRSQYLLEKGNSVMQSLLGQLIKLLLQDGSDQVQVAVLSLLMKMTCFVLTKEDREEVKTEKEDMMILDDMIKAGLQALIVDFTTNPRSKRSSTAAVYFGDLIDMWLRTLCILDPKRFDLIIRQEMVEESGPHHSKLVEEEEIKDIINGLMNHADILMAL